MNKGSNTNKSFKKSKCYGRGKKVDYRASKKGFHKSIKINFKCRIDFAWHSPIVKCKDDQPSWMVREIPSAPLAYP